MGDEMDVEQTNNDSGGKLSQAFPLETLRLYYARVFPAKLLFKWLGYGDPEYFARREVALTKKDREHGEDIYIRFKSYADADSFKRDLIAKDDQPPHKIDFGAVYNVSPKQKATVAVFEPQEKELVFDIDANDYDDVRVCKCKGTPSVCGVCWRLLVTAIKVIDAALRQDFGFQHIAWIFSGRRGVHCWVCDPRARKLSQDARQAVASYIAVNIGGKGQRHTPFKKDVHPALERAYHEALEPYFMDIVKNHGLLDHPEHVQRILNYAPPHPKELLEQAWANATLSSEEKWEQFQATVNKFRTDKKLNNNPVYDVVFYYSYPRLDIQVSRQFNHLLKSPFVIHPGTGKICVPIDVSQLDSFDPDKTPTIQTILDELNAHTDTSTKLKDWQKTSLAPYIQFFKRFVNGAIQAAVKAKKEQTQTQPSMDF